VNVDLKPLVAFGSSGRHLFNAGRGARAQNEDSAHFFGSYKTIE
jgi:hypothetical protein